MKNLFHKLPQKITIFVLLFLMTFTTSFACKSLILSDLEFNQYCCDPIVDGVTGMWNDFIDVVNEITALSTDNSILQNLINVTIPANSQMYDQIYNDTSGKFQQYVNSVNPLDQSLNVLSFNSDNNGIFKTAISTTNSGVTCKCDKNNKNCTLTFSSTQLADQTDDCLNSAYTNLSSMRCPLAEDAPNTVENTQIQANCITQQSQTADALKNVVNNYLNCVWACVNIGGKMLAVHPNVLNSTADQLELLLTNSGFKTTTFNSVISAIVPVMQTVETITNGITTVKNGIDTMSSTVQQFSAKVSTMSQQVQIGLSSPASKGK